MSPQAAEYQKAMEQTLKDLYTARINKLIHIAGRDSSSKKPPENATPQEAKVFESLISAIEIGRTQILESPIENKTKPEPETLLNIRFLSPLPQLVASDGGEYGPYNVGDTSKLPLSTAKLLIEKGAAENASEAPFK